MPRGRPKKSRATETREIMARKSMSKSLTTDVSHLKNDPKHTGCTFRWVNNEAGRVQKFINEGWEVVEGDASPGIWRPNEETVKSDSGSVTSIPVGPGRTVDAMDAILMKISIERFNEMEAQKTEMRNARDRALQQHGALADVSGIETYAAQNSQGSTGMHVESSDTIN